MLPRSERAPNLSPLPKRARTRRLVWEAKQRYPYRGSGIFTGFPLIANLNHPGRCLLSKVATKARDQSFQNPLVFPRSCAWFARVVDNRVGNRREGENLMGVWERECGGNARMREIKGRRDSFRRERI